MKRILACVLCLAMMCSVFAVSAAAEEAEAAIAAELPEELVVGHTTEMAGNFFSEMFGNNTADIDARTLLQGYNLVDWDQDQGVYILNPEVVTAVEVTEDVDGSHVYRMTLARDLKFSDGSAITAWDYAFSYLLMIAPEMEKIGGKVFRAEHLQGYREYIQGNADSLAGVHVTDDYTLIVTLDGDYLPFFYEVGLLMCVPFPISVIAPECSVYDIGEGCYIANAENPNAGTPLFTPELLEKTMLDPETGYVSHPAVVSGPCTLTSFDGVTAHFELNPYYKRNPIVITKIVEAEGENAETAEEELEPETIEVVIDEDNPGYIKKICFTLADNDTIEEQLLDGTLHLVNKVTYGPLIQNLMRTDDEQEIRFQYYPRIGLSFLTFSYDWATVNEMAVRQAIAWCMDRDQLTQDYCGAFGLRVDGYYGIEQWEYLIVNGTVGYPLAMADGTQSEKISGFPNRVAKTDAEYEEMFQAWEELSLDGLTAYTVDTGKANQLLENAGWTLNRQGEKYNAETDDVRCKRINNQLVALDLKMMYPAGNHIVDTLQENFIDNLNQCGIQLTLVPAPMDELLSAYYRETERTTDMIYLATNFHTVYDPSITYSVDNSALHQLWNNTYSDDELLYQLAVDMRRTQPGDTYSYVTKWIAFQQRYNEVLPAIPVYSNIYYDFYNSLLQNYDVTAHITWSQAILDAYFGEEEEAPEEEAEEEDGQTASFED